MAFAFAFGAVVAVVFGAVAAAAADDDDDFASAIAAAVGAAVGAVAVVVASAFAASAFAATVAPWKWNWELFRILLVVANLLKDISMYWCLYLVHPCDKGSNGGCNQVCNKVGDDFTCSCNEGYTLSVDKESCVAGRIQLSRVGTSLFISIGTFSFLLQ